MLKQLSIIALALILVVGSTAQMMPRDAGTPIDPASPAASTMGMSSDSGGAGSPCKGMTPACLDKLGCAAIAAAPVAPASLPITVRWVQIIYAASTEAMAGHSPKPELFPPILSA